MISLLLILKIAQLFAIMSIGYLITKLNVVKEEDSLVMSKISIYVLLPAAILNSFNTELSGTVKQGLIIAFIASISVHIIFYVIDVVYKKTVRASSVERASIIYPNVANLIIPIVTYILGNEWVIYICAYLSVQIVFLWTHGIGMFDVEKKKILSKIIFNPCILSIAVGLLLMFCKIKLPRIVWEIPASLGNMLGPVSMLIAGMVLAQSDLKSLLGHKRAYFILLMRMIVCPVIVLLLFKFASTLIVVENSKNILLITFLSSISPTAATIMQFSQIYDNDVELAVSANIITTISCIVTMPVLVFLYLL